MKKPTFTIVTPSFNQGDFIEETIKSILDQEGSFTIEHIIADAGSKDETVKIIKKYARALERGTYPIKCKGVSMVWWSKPDKGQSDALNQGFRLAKGEIVAWLNSDDVYQPGALKAAQQAMKAHPKAGLVYSDHMEIDGKSRELRRLELPDFDFGYVANGNIVSQPASFMRKAALDKVGLLNPDYHYAMDYDLWMRIAKKYEVIHVPGYWAGFRLHDDSKTVALASKFYKEERAVSRENGGRFFSRIYLHRLSERRPFLARIVGKLVSVVSPEQKPS
jgi:glycosyltransferase involved in cell wall biosynthesis